MVIGFVVDSFDDLNNGTTCSARRFVSTIVANFTAPYAVNGCGNVSSVCRSAR